MSVKSSAGLYELLQDAELTHHYTGLKNILQIQNVGQLKYVKDEDLASLGMSKPETRRLKTFYNKHCSTSYASKLRKLLGRKDEVSKDEFLLGEEIISSKGSIKVPTQHLIPGESVTVYKELGEGEFGVVQQAVWTDEDGMRHQVAVKCLSKKRMQNNTVEFMKEYEMMQTIDHNNIVRLYGVVLDADNIMLITELAPLRSLLECLREQSLRATFTVACLAQFCQQICQGMVYLEDKRLIHRDLAARNILVFNKNLVKISDFGLSRALGVGKDYYQTNFNVNLKLPIAWCAPECINFLKFTSASDVWAFGVTMWEMFSYGFQPWAAMTGHQILEAIDEEGGQRLDKPTHCPRDHYQVMEATWRHRPDDRPSFKEVGRLLDDARPEQVQVIVPGGGPGLLQYNVGDILTVLDKRTNMEQLDPAGRTLWSGVNNEGKVGMFLPSHTVTYLGNLPASQASWTNQSEQPGIFTRATGLRSSKERSSKRKISRDMISGPTGQVQHTGHVGPDGAFFGDVTFISSSSTNGNLTTTNTTTSTVGGRLPSTGSDNGFPSWKADSDASDSAPLLSSNNRKSSHDKPSQPRMMGHAIGYLRKQPEAISEPLGNTLAATSLSMSASISGPVMSTHHHQYQSISDEETDADFGSPLDLGPSLMDEVFSELENYDNLQGISRKKDLADKVEDVSGDHHQGIQGIVDSCHKFADKVTTTMTLSRKHKGKKAAYVKPIKASDERTLENAILMANQIASKSMHDLDKRCTDDMFNASPQVSPITPNSPTKKFTFKFPSSTSRGNKGGSSHSPTRHFTDEVNQRSDINAAISPTARDAYKVLIEGEKSSYSGGGGPSSDHLDSLEACNLNLVTSSGGLMASSSSGLTSSSMTSSMMSSTKCSPSPGHSSHRLSLPPNSAPLSNSSSASSCTAAALTKQSYDIQDSISARKQSYEVETIGGRNTTSIYEQDILPRTTYDEQSAHSFVNPLPLPPKDRKSSVTSGGKRHTRKNPLIIPTGMAANMARRAESLADEETSNIQQQNFMQQDKASNSSRGSSMQRFTTASSGSLQQHTSADSGSLQQHTTVGSSSLQQNQQMNVSRSGSSKNFDSYNDAFEEEIACNMDALDDLQDAGGGGVSGLVSKFDKKVSSSRYSDRSGSTDSQYTDNTQHWRSAKDQGDGEDIYSRGRNTTTRRGVDSDEVRIMSKVLGGVTSDKNDCLQALNITDWNVHKAIKIMKLRRLIPGCNPTFSELKISLMNNEWDISKAATSIK